MEDQPSFSVVPDSVVFYGTEPGDTDTIEVLVTNKSRNPAQFRFSVLPRSKFSIHVANQGLIPVGLEAKVLVKYKCDEQKDISEELTIETPEYSMKIPIIARIPCPVFKPDKSLINVGEIGVGIKTKVSFNLLNVGVLDGSYELLCDDENVTFIPSGGLLLSNQSCEVSITLCVDEIGDFERVFTVKSKGFEKDNFQMKVVGKTIGHSLSLCIDDVETNSLTFSTVFAGQKRFLDATLKNTGPFKRSFVIIPPSEDPISEQREDNLSRRINKGGFQYFSSIPCEGTIPPYQSTVIRFVFSTNPKHSTDENVETEIMNYSAIEVVETAQRIPFQLKGTYVPHRVSLLNTNFDFGYSKVMESSCKNLKIVNNSSFLPITFNIRPVAHFRFNPESGTIPSNGCCEVDIVFQPKLLGDINISAVVSFSDGLSKKKINLRGKSTNSGKEVEKFVRKEPWEADDEMKYRAMHPDVRFGYHLDEMIENKKKRDTYDKFIRDPLGRYQSNEVENEKMKSLFQKAKLELSSSVGSKYTQEDLNKYVLKMLQKEIDDPFHGDKDDSLGSDPVLRKRAPAPLYIPNPEKFGLKGLNKDNFSEQDASKAALQFDDSVLIEKKYKSKPITPVEVSECSNPLTPAQQMQITPSHETLNFGSVAIFTTAAKSFAITNNLQQHILASIDYEYDELSQSGPQSQVIPPKQTAGFDVRFTSKIQQNFMKTIRYSINGSHHYSLNVGAQVTPVDVQLSRSTVEFRFNDDATQPLIREFVSLINRSSTGTKYSWSNLRHPFYIEHIEGKIEANKTLNIEIKYTPGVISQDECTVTLDVVGGQSRTLKLIANIGSPKCILSKKLINFGLLPIGIGSTQQLKVRNDSEDDAIFNLDTKNAPELTIIPMNGRIPANDNIILNVSFVGIQARYFDLPVTVNICGAQPITFSVQGQVEMPQVQIINPSFDFGCVYVGSYIAIEGKIRNVGEIPAILFLDLSAHPQFRIEYHADLNTAEDSNRNSISLVSEQLFITKMANANELRGTSSLSVRSIDDTSGSNNENNSGQLASSRDKNSGLTYRIHILQHTEITFNLVFQPTEPGDFSFELPVTMMNVISSSSFHLQPIVSAEAIRAPLVVSVSEVDFGLSPLYDERNIHQKKNIQQISIYNQSGQKCNWRFDLGSTLFSGFKKTFKVEPENGVLDVKESTIVTVCFMARTTGPIISHLPIYVTNDRDEESLVAKVQLIAVGKKQRISLSRTSISLPIVPIGIKTQADLLVLNDGCISTPLNVQMSVDENHFPLKVTFPEGNDLLPAVAKLPINVSFQSNKPMSFSAVVAITDDDNNVCSFTVSVTTDSSVFTTYPFYSNPVKLNPKNAGDLFNAFSERAELTCRFTSTSDVTLLKGALWEPSCSSAMIRFVFRYFNTLVFGSQISSFPDDLVSNQGLALFEMIHNFQGNNIQNSFEKSAAKQVSDTAFRHIETLRRLLDTLKSLGGLLSHVRPEFLLPKSEFIQVMKTSIIKSFIGVNYACSPKLETLDQKVLGEYTSTKCFSTKLSERIRVLEDVYGNLSVESWMMVIMQAYKVLIFGRLSGNKLASLPGLSEIQKSIKSNSKEDPVSLIDSKLRDSVMSHSERSLLRWCALLQVHSTGSVDVLPSSFRSLSNGLAFCSLIKHYTSFLKVIPHLKPTDASQREQNAIEFSNSIKNLKLSFQPTADEIVDSSQCINAMVAAFLFETLPHFVPSQTLEFHSTLHKPISKSITINNPSKTEIIYKVIYSGSPNFSLSSEMCVVGPNQSVEFPVMMSPKTIKQFSGKVTLLPSRPRLLSENSTSPVATGRAPQRIPQFSAAIAFNLMSFVTAGHPEKTFNIETPIYEHKNLQIHVKNVFNTPSECKIYMKTSYISDEYGRDISNQKHISQQIMEFIENPQELADQLEPQSRIESYTSLINSHRTFIKDADTLTFTEPTQSLSINVDFVPIRLGKFRCLLLFVDSNVGEFVYEVIGKSELPSYTEINSSKFKIEAGKKMNSYITLDLVNNALCKSLAYSIEVLNEYETEGKLNDAISRRQRDIETLARNTIQPTKLDVTVSSLVYFDAPRSVTIQRKKSEESSKTENNNTIPIVFKPIKAGEYPCKILLMSEYDVRAMKIKGTGIPASHEYTIEINTVTGNVVKQDIPLSNSSKTDSYNFKINLIGSDSFSVPNHIAVKPSSTTPLTVTFTPSAIDRFVAELVISNLSRESTVYYKLIANVGEPLAEEKVVINCKARLLSRHSIPIRKFLQRKALTVNMESTNPLISLPPTFTFDNSKPTTDLVFEINAPRSGLTTGTITFTDPETNQYIWVVVEVNVSPPTPQQSIEVDVVARNTVTIQIPISNQKDGDAEFQVSFSDPDATGEKSFVVPPRSSIAYSLNITPLRAIKKSISVHFYSEDDGEFWYNIIVNVSEPPANTLAPLSASIGKYASTHIVLENPHKMVINFRVENDNPNVFTVISKKLIMLQPGEQKKIEVRYTPSMLGVKETALIAFKNTDFGEYKYILSGIGKPPNPLSPVIVSCVPGSANSAMLLFTNPFSFPSKFSISMQCEHENMFNLLSKKRTFVLRNFGEEYQIPFLFSAHELGQYNATVIIASMGPSSESSTQESSGSASINWVYPLVGNCISSDVNEVKLISGYTHEVSTTSFSFDLIGEKEAFEFGQYTTLLDLPEELEFLRSQVDVKIAEIDNSSNTTNIVLDFTFSPKRPVNDIVNLIIRNPLSQEWSFKVQFRSEISRIRDLIQIESFLNKSGTVKIKAPVDFRSNTLYHAYFASNSSSEFNVSPTHGIISSDIPKGSEMEIEVTFLPKMYGKVLKGLLVLDTLDSQFLFDIIGKTPEYKPPHLNAPARSPKPSKRKNVLSDTALIKKPVLQPKVEF